MKKKLIGTILCASLLSVSLGTKTFAAEVSKDQKIKVARNYIESNKKVLNKKFNDLKENPNVTLIEIEDLIANYYEQHSPPSVFKDENLSIEDVYPEEIQKAKQKDKKEKVFNINNFFKENKNGEYVDGNLFEFESVNTKTNVFLANTGDIMISESKSVPAINEPPIQYALPMESTNVESTKGISYNSAGGKLFEVQAEGQWSYNGTILNNTYADGYYQRFFWGSTLNITNINLGKVRNITQGSYKYSEVYSNVYVESVVGFRWAGLVLNSSVCEAYVGATPNGSTYGSVKVK